MSDMSSLPCAVGLLCPCQWIWTEIISGMDSDNQDLGLTGNSLSLTNDATPVDLSPYLDNTDNQATDVFQLNSRSKAT